MLFRYGGEEFLILLSGTTAEGAGQLAERIRSNIESLAPFPDQDFHTTVSLGVASLIGDENSSSLFERADQALYRAKLAGRNQVVTG